MQLLELGTPDRAQRAVAAAVAHVKKEGLRVGWGSSSCIGRKGVGREVSDSNSLVVLLRGEGLALDGAGRRERVVPGQAVFWPAGSWFAFETLSEAGSDVLSLHGQDVSLDLLR
jgi:hypothetical protein